MTTFKGHKTGFKPGESNKCVPNAIGPPKTKFGGRSALPPGPLKHYPGSTADTSGGNRRLSKTAHGEGDGCGTSFRTINGFGGGKKGK